MSERHPSLERSLQWTLGILMLVAFILIITAMIWVGGKTIKQFMLTRLSHDGEAIIAALDLQQQTLTRTLSPVYQQPASGHYFTIEFDDGRQLRSRSLWDAKLPFAPLAPGEMDTALVTGQQAQHLLIWSAGYEKERQPFTIAIAEDIEPLFTSLRHLIGGILLVTIAIILSLLLIQRLLLRKGFCQLEKLRKEVWQLGCGEQKRLNEAVPAEVKPLVQEFNQLAEGWRNHMERSRNAVSNLAHALKTPLQLLLAHGKQVDDPMIIDAVTQMHDLVNRELKRARIIGKASAIKRFKPQTDLPDLIAIIQKLHADKQLQISLRTATSTYLPFDQEDMLELSGNLLDNAAKWATRQISVDVTMDNLAMSIAVDDDGPGSDSKPLRLQQRGVKMDEHIPGHGLGLAIVQDIADSYGGRLIIGRSQALGGFQAGVKLPLNRHNQQPTH